MKIIDLLNKIANGEELPEKIKLGNGKIFQLDEDNAYWCDDIDYSSNWLSNEYIFGHNDLNKTIEIIEEEKKIPEKICTNRIINTKDILEFEMIQNKINAEYTHAINSIIDYLKSKGDE